jgi:hypothetical protein
VNKVLNIAWVIGWLLFGAAVIHYAFTPQPTEAGAPPSDVIPWDTAWAEDTTVTLEGDTAVNRYPCQFITREKYEEEVLGWKSRQDVRNIRRDLEAIKQAVRKKADDP